MVEVLGRAKGGYIPIPKFLGRDSKRGFLTALVVLLTPWGAGAGFLPDPDLALGWSLRRGTSVRCVWQVPGNRQCTPELYRPTRERDGPSICSASSPIGLSSDDMSPHCYADSEKNE